MTLVKRFSEDTADPIRMLIGTEAQPQNLDGATAAIVLKDLGTGTRITSGTTTIDTPAQSGYVRRAWQSGELVAGKRYAVECVLTIPGAGTRTYPGPEDEQLIIEVVPRRT